MKVKSALLKGIRPGRPRTLLRMRAWAPIHARYSAHYYVVCLIIYACKGQQALTCFLLIGLFGGAKESGYPES